MALVQVITIAKDNENGLIATLESLLDQTFEDWNAVIVCAPSKDKTMEVAHNYARKNPKIVVRIQVGKGIYDAMNYGTEKTQSKYLWYMNSGDCFKSKQTLSLAVSEIEKSGAALLIGRHEILDSQRSFKSPWKKLKPFTFAFDHLGGCHQAMIFNSNYLNLAKVYDLRFKFAADYALALSLVAKFGGIRSTEIFCVMEPYGTSAINLKNVYKEKQEIRNEILGEMFYIKLLGFVWTKSILFYIYLGNLIKVSTRSRK